MAETHDTRAMPPELAQTERAQREASDPAASAWVSANAGAGKTHVLKMRVLRLLLAGTPPERILCLTYTKAAAAEMAQRVFADLGAWATADDATLTERLAKLVGRKPEDGERVLARQLFARAIETPGGLKVQTIHAFCERLLHRFPLEAGVPPGFEILDDATAAGLRREAADTVLAEATRDTAGRLGRALASVAVFAAGDGFDVVLDLALGERAWLEDISRLELMADDGEDAAGRLYRRALGLEAEASRDAVEAAMACVLDDAMLARTRDVLLTGSKTDQENAEALGEALSAPGKAARIAALEGYFLTGKGEPRSRLATAAVKKANPEAETVLSRAQSRFVDLSVQRKALTLADATVALATLAGAVLERYGEAKARRPALDFDDLVVRSASLLGRSEAAEWVLYKLDGGLDHILVDEAQDTSPVQWRVIEALAAEFFAGSGAREEPRTVFAVGDEKQSIYSFQGAAPRMFAETGSSFASLAAQARRPWRMVPLTLSFRAVEPLLAAIDRVFADAAAMPGLTAGGGAMRHLARRRGQAGFLEIWPTEVWAEAEAAPAWEPLAEPGVASPVLRLAARIADTIRGWLDRGERLTSEDRPVRAGDVLLLVRARHQLAAAMVAALKARRIPVAGADRIRLTEQIAVQDLMALCDFLALPEDDLALAVVLKSPLFDLDDDDLLGFAPGRKGTLWSALLAAARSDPRLAPAAAQLKEWRRQADFSPPFEFLASVLDRDGSRARLLARLGPDASDPIDELVNLALAYDDCAPPSLQGFLHWLRQGGREIKRDMEHGRDEVRVMTVHGAKGLEAPIVFLPDTCTAPTRRRPGRLVALAGAEHPAGMEPPLVWPVKGTSGHPAVQAGHAAADAEDIAEHNRLLYVAMTRARDRLYVAGYEGKNGRARGCWYDLIMAGAKGLAKPVALPGRGTVLRIEAGQSAAHDDRREEAAGAIAPEPLPAWAQRKARAEAQPTMPLAPSRLAPYDIDEAGEPAEPKPRAEVVRDPPSPSPTVLAAGSRFLRGTITHALLEHLPAFAPERWEAAAKAFVHRRGAALSDKALASIVAEALAVLRDPLFAPVFGPGSRAEVPIVADIARPGGGPSLRVDGQIDRLAILDDAIVIIDYKTNRPPPADVAGVAEAYLYQLAAYRLGVQQVFAGEHARPVRAAILWTDGARLMPVPDDVLAGYERRLWTLDAARLDG
jgi:ATP-dependent helicase/nuclease subunit A